MARLLVVGGTGTAGRAVVLEAVARGHRVAVLSRHAATAPVEGVQYVRGDLIAGTGLQEALFERDALIDTSNASVARAQKAFATGALNLVQTAARFGVRRAVPLSIVGVEGAESGYYRAKREQELVYLDSVLDTRVVRATQFHSFVTALFAVPGIIPVFHGVRFQPIALDDVARFLVDAATRPGEPDSIVNAVGPQLRSSAELAATYRRVTGSSRRLVRVPLPGALGRDWRAGRNVLRGTSPATLRGTIRYEDDLTG